MTSYVFYVFVKKEWFSDSSIVRFWKLNYFLVTLKIKDITENIYLFNLKTNFTLQKQLKISWRHTKTFCIILLDWKLIFKSALPRAKRFFKVFKNELKSYSALSNWRN